eukprot:COSAG01_NODE_22004_length_876_cov_1.316602_1_plen_81_part_10
MQLDRRAARADNSALSLAAVQSSCTAIAHNHQISLPTIEVVWGHQSQPVQLDLHARPPARPPASHALSSAGQRTQCTHLPE